MIRRTVLTSPAGTRARKMSGATIPVSFWPQTPRAAFEARPANPARIPLAPALPVDVFTSSDRAVVRAALPGVHPEQIDVSVYRNTVTIRAEQPSAANWQSDQITWHVAELGHGSLERTIRLPFLVEEQNVEAQFANGMLQLSLPRLEADKPHRISVQVRPDLSPELTAGDSEEESFAAD